MRLNSILKIWCLSLICCGVLACESLPSGRSSPEKTTAFKLPPIPVPRDSVEVDIVFIDRPASDPMLGKTLWREVDQVGALTTEQRAAIRAAGIQVGHVGSSPPDVLQSLLNLASDESERKRREANGIPQTSARRIILPAGSDTEINASEPIPSRDIDFPDGRHLELLEVHGNLRLRAERSQEGWARLDFLPEFHHGQTKTRPFAAQTGWTFRTTQEVLPLFAQRFTATLNVGEMVVITADRDRPGTLGQALFQFEDATGPKQRVIVVRLADLREIAPVRMRQD